MGESHFGEGGILMNVPCNVISDLIPLVKDGVASEESAALVHDHIKICEQCLTEYELFQTMPLEQPSLNDVKIIRAIKRSMVTTQLSILIVGAILGIALTNSMGMFYNFMIMPLVGALSLVSLKKKAYVTPLAIFAVTYVWQTIVLMTESDEWSWMIFVGGTIYSAIYTGLVCFGMLIAWLLIFAIKKEEVENGK